MQFPSSPLRNFAAFTGLALLLSSCIFDSKYPDPPRSKQDFTTVVLDTIYSSSAVVDSVVTLFQPLFDPELGLGAVGPRETLAPVNIRDHVTGKMIQYRTARQRFGSWNGELEFKWNFFLLKTNFLFAQGMSDTAGLEEKTPTLFQRVHAQDSFTNYFDSVDAPRIWTRITTSTKPGAIGVAVKLSKTKDTVLIQQVIAGSPAGRAGLIKGMAILAVNDSVIVGDSAIERFSRFSVGDSGSAVRFEVSGPGSTGPQTYDMRREPVAFPTVMIDSIQGVGYLSISGFTPNTVGSKSTYTEFRDGLVATRNFPVTLIDLRDNGGGSLDEALKMCDEILPAGDIIIRQLQRRFEESVHAPIASEITAIATAGGVGEKTPDGSRRKYLLLGNGHSASASEIFLVAVREGADAPLMGTKTYGKGVGQTVRNTPGKGLALITFLKFTSRGNLDYHLHGLIPDYVDSADSDTLLDHAAQKALAMAGGPAPKVSAGFRRNVSREAAVVEWNRRQTVRPGVMELEALP